MRRWSRWALVFAAMFLATEIVAISTATDANAQQRRRGRRSRRAQPPPPPPPAPTQAPTSFRGPTRVDFDDRLIQGQTNKSGAVYLFSRKETNISSMVRRRKSFRHLTIRTIYDR